MQNLKEFGYSPTKPNPIYKYSDDGKLQIVFNCECRIWRNRIQKQNNPKQPICIN
jgi:hypothetical protein